MNFNLFFKVWMMENTVGVFPQDVLFRFYLGLIISCDTLNYLINRSSLLRLPVHLSLSTLITPVQMEAYLYCSAYYRPSFFPQELNNRKWVFPPLSPGGFLLCTSSYPDALTVKACPTAVTAWGRYSEI